MSSIVLHKPAELQVMADNVYQSGMFGLKNKNQVYTLMLIAQSEGTHPIDAVQQYNVINGLPAMKTLEKHTRFNKSGGKLKWLETTDKIAKAEMSHPSYDGKYISEFTIEEAQAMGLTGRDNWKKMPKKMLMARCLSFGINAIAPDCLGNVKYTVEDLQDEIIENDDEPKSEIIEGDIIPELDIKELKRTLTRRLKVDYNYNDAMIKEFAELFDISENVENLSKMVEDNEYLLKCIEQFEKENN